MAEKKTRVLLGLSGGVDSSFSAYSLQKEGYEVEAAFLIMHDHSDPRRARETCGSLGIPLREIDVRSLFSSIVEADFVSEYAKARTPNPCVLCNREVKFRSLLDHARKNGFDKIATGHYADVVFTDGRYAVRAVPSAKDQSYMLCRLSQEELSSVLFPVGHCDKPALRVSARQAGLPSADDKDSLEICFIPDNDRVGYLSRRLSPFKEGNFISPEGEVAGRHKGIPLYTVGQRKGLGVSLGRPVYVSRMDGESGDIYLEDRDAVFSGFTAESPVFQATDEASSSSAGRYDCKVRYSSSFLPVNASCSGGIITAYFDSPVRTVTPGQSAVFYRDGVVCFSGIIRSGIPAGPARP